MTNKVQPIRPDEIEEVKESSLPDEALEAFNELIVQKFVGGYATVRQSDVRGLDEGEGLEPAYIVCYFLVYRLEVIEERIMFPILLGWNSIVWELREFQELQALLSA